MVVRHTRHGVGLDGQGDAIEQAELFEFLAVERRIAATRGVPCVEVRQLGLEHDGLQRIKAEIAADFLVMVLRAHPMVAHQLDLHG